MPIVFPVTLMGEAGLPVFSNASQYSASSLSTHPVTAPTGVQVGDILVLMLYCTTAPYSISSITGWTSIGAATAQLARYRIATGSDACSVVFAASETIQASIARYTPGNGFDVGDFANLSGDVTLSATSTRAVTDIVGAATVTSTILTPSGFSLDTNFTVGGTNFYWFSRQRLTAGTTGTITIDESGTNPLGAALACAY